MKVLWLEPIGGISGDMVLGALVDLGVPVEVLEASLSTLDVKGWSLGRRRRELMGITATKIDVVIEGEDAHHRTWRTIRGLIEDSGLTAGAKALASETFERLAVAEGKVHGIAPEDVHFHEVGAIDAIVDVCGMAVAIDHLSPDVVHAAPPPLGTGFVEAAHGRIPIPAPATMELLRGLPVASSDTVGELTTPTGAAILATLAAGRVGAIPPMTVDRVGYGCGDATWPDRPNVLRATLGQAAGKEAAEGPVVHVVEADIDDFSPELLAPALEAILAAGALDATLTPVVMKKGRPGHLLRALCRPDAEQAVVRAILEETSTLGVRIHPARRVEADRRMETVETAYGPVRVKVASLAGETLGAAPEFEDCRTRAKAHGVPIRTVHAAALAAWYGA